MVRKTLAIAGAVVGLALLGSFLYKGRAEKPQPVVQTSTVSSAQTYFDTFPDAVPGMRSVNKYWTPNAKYVLVHVRDFHFRGPNTMDLTRELVLPVQDDIERGLRYLVKEGHVKTIHYEGFTPAGVRELEGLLKEREQERAYIQTALAQERQRVEALRGRQRAAGLRKLRMLEELVSEQEADSSRFDEWIEGQVGVRLYQAGVLGLKGAEIQSYRDETQKAIAGGELWPLEQEKREHALLALVAGHKEAGEIVTVYGGMHAWGGVQSFPDYNDRGRPNMVDNIAQWNQEDPEHSFALIELTPEHYPLD